MRIPRPLIAIATVAAVAAIAVGCDDDDASDRIAAVCDAQEGVAAAVSNLQAFDPTTDSADDLDDARNDVEDAVDDYIDARDDLGNEYSDSLESAFEDLKGSLEDLTGEPLSEAAPQALAEARDAAVAFQAEWDQALADADC